MDLINNLLRSLSIKAPKQSKNQPLQQELIKRSDPFKQGYDEWKNSVSTTQILKGLYEKYLLKQNDDLGDVIVTILKSPYANGVYFTYHQDIPAIHFAFLFDLLKEKVLDLGYSSYISDRTIHERADFFETVERHYLKPDISLNTGEKCHQLFGNILIEHVLIDEKPSYLKLLSTVYSDAMYHPALPYQELMEKLFTDR